MAMDSTEAGSVSSPKGNMILVVEDDDRTSRLECFVLAEEGYSVTCAGSGEEALDMLTRTTPSLVILDIGLPNMDGFATCQKIRESSQVPIIMVTAEGRDEDKVRGLEMGADDYITKPFSTNEFAARVNAVLRRINAGRTKTLADRPRPAELVVPLPKERFGKSQSGDTGGISALEITPEITPVITPVITTEVGKRTRVKPRKTAGKDDHPANNPAKAGDVLTANNENYEGTVKLVVETKGAIKNMVDFVDTLRENPQFHLLRMVSHARRDGMDVWLRLREPNPLRATLLAAAGVSKVEPLERSEVEPETAVLKVSLD